MSSVSSCVAPSMSERSDRLVGVEDLETAWLSVRFLSMSEMSERAFSLRGEVDMKEATAAEALVIVTVEEGEIEDGVEVVEERAVEPKEVLLLFLSAFLPLVRSMG